MSNRFSRQSVSRRIAQLLFLSILIPAGTPFAAPFHGTITSPAQIQSIIRNRLTESPTAETLVCQGELLCGIQILPQAYREANYCPLWIDNTFRLERAHALIDSIAKATEDGLNPADYHLSSIQGLLWRLYETPAETEAIAANRWADLDLMLTDAFMLYGSHLAAGRVDPETLNTDWKVNPGPVDLLEALGRAVATGNIASAFELLRPPFSGYRNLRKALAQLRELADCGGWPTVPPAETLRPGEHHPAVERLRQRLIASGDLKPADPLPDETLFDPVLVDAVKGFQRRNGLATDGVVGRATYGMLNIPVEQRIRQVSLNLERWRWLPHHLGERYLMINTADFNLNAVEDDRVVLTMRVVVGRPARRSPVFSARMSYLVINPYWTVPTTIAVNDILPELQKDATYLTQRGIRLYASWRDDAAELDPTTIDWQAYNENRFPFRLRQDPGPYNALGRIKFMFPNQFAVYLHDTPNRSLFRRTKRDLSSGCIRVEAPIELAAFVLAEDTAWTSERIREQIESGETKTIQITHRLSVHLVYMTAWADERGELEFRGDIYQHDQDLQRAFNQRRTAPQPGFVSQPDQPTIPADI